MLPNCRTGWNKGTGRNISKNYLPYRSEIAVQGGFFSHTRYVMNYYLLTLSHFTLVFMNFHYWNVMFGYSFKVMPLNKNILISFINILINQLPYRTLIRAYRVEFFSKNHERTCTAIRVTRVVSCHTFKISYCNCSKQCFQISFCLWHICLGHKQIHKCLRNTHSQ